MSNFHEHGLVQHQHFPANISTEIKLLNQLLLHDIDALQVHIELQYGRGESTSQHSLHTGKGDAGLTEWKHTALKHTPLFK